MDFPLEPVSSRPIYDARPAEAIILSASPAHSGDSAVGSSRPEQSVIAVINQEGTPENGVVGNIQHEDNGPVDSVQSTGHEDPQALDGQEIIILYLRVCVGRSPPNRTHCPGRQSALVKSIRSYAEKLGDEGASGIEESKMKPWSTVH